jgi:hypothetical protein
MPKSEANKTLAEVGLILGLSTQTILTDERNALSKIINSLLASEPLLAAYNDDPISLSLAIISELGITNTLFEKVAGNTLRRMIK